jgi:uncharacterized protein YdeI (YjbR/CyaY-like superfamily)
VARGSESDPIFFRSPAEFRKWLGKNHEKADELWIGYWKKATGKPSLTWQQTVDECLCFGWIDGIRKSIDADSYKQRVTPRRAKSIWSLINVRRVGVLQAEGRMTPRGLAEFERRKVSGVYSFEQREHKALDPKYAAQFKKRSARGWKYYESQPPGRKKLITWWVMSAKKEETRLKRLDRLIEACDAGRPIGVLTPKSELPRKVR